MARVRITEYTAKTILKKYGVISSTWKGYKASNNTSVGDIKDFFGTQLLVVKVDQGIKKRGARGLVKINVNAHDAHLFIKNHSSYSSFLIEPFVNHKPEEEQYISLERIREGWKILYSKKGGIDVEKNWASVISVIVPHNGMFDKKKLGSIFCSDIYNNVKQIINLMNKYDAAFLECNPFLLNHGFEPLDCALLIDDASQVVSKNSYIKSGIVKDNNSYSVEKYISNLDSNTPSSLKFTMLNPNGSIWVLLSGGGASLVIVDEIADRGFGGELANYGEYSGNPSAADTYLYADAVISAMLASKAEKKVLIIAGGVANFTDVYKTFIGIIKALKKHNKEIQKQNIKLFVRRGGPNQEKGLNKMKEFLGKYNMYGYVVGPDENLYAIISRALDHISKSG